MQNLLETYSPKNVLIFSGDRHISEFSQKELTSFSYPLTDFTSSGLTHSYTSYDGEPNQYRVGEVVYETSYGIVDLDFKENTAELYIKSTDDAEVLERLKLKF
jgi:alkaline phosphatase D